MPTSGSDSEAFVFGQFVKPGLHCVLIYDPTNQTFYKKIITLHPNRSEGTTSTKLVEDQLLLGSPGFADLPIQLFGSASDFISIFKSDLDDEAFESFVLQKDIDQLKPILKHLCQNYETICEAYLGVTMGLCSSRSEASGDLDRITAAGMSVDELYTQAFSQNDVEISE